MLTPICRVYANPRIDSIDLIILKIQNWPISYRLISASLGKYNFGTVKKDSMGTINIQRNNI
jgi:hypothetical protein